jgi:ferritin-like metal-binding protein YciE
MKAGSMMELYVSELQDMFAAEEMLIRALPKMAERSNSPELADAFQHHLSETKEHSNRLREIITRLGHKPGGERCKAMEGLIAEGEDILKARGEDDVRDAGIIVAAQKVEHYEIAGYGSLCAFARHLGRQEDMSLLQATLEEEKNADRTLTNIAESEINVEASGD